MQNVYRCYIATVTVIPVYLWRWGFVVACQLNLFCSGA